MSWSVTLAAMPREDAPAILDEHRQSKGGYVPDAVVEIIAAEVEGLEPTWDKVAVTTYGHLGSGSPRTVTINVTGTA